MDLDIIYLCKTTTTPDLEGLFVSAATSVSDRPTIKNLTVRGQTNTYKPYLKNTGSGCIVKKQQKFFVLDNCHVGDFIGFTSIEGGIICGKEAGYSGGDVLIKNCSNHSNNEPKSSTYTFMAGIVGPKAGYEGSCVIRDCTNNANLSNSNQSAGIAGYKAGAGTSGNPGYCAIYDCTNDGAIRGAGITGYDCANPYGKAIAINCTNNAAIGSYCGGIFGEYSANNGGTIIANNCINNGAINSEWSGGIVGPRSGRQSTSTVRIKNCKNTGNVKGGGIIGKSCGDSGGTINITNSYNTGDIVSSNAGGIIGKDCGGNINIDSCYSNQDVNNSLTNSSGFIASNIGYGSSSTNICKVK